MKTGALDWPSGGVDVKGYSLLKDQDGWVLIAAYDHQAGTNPDLVPGVIPESPTKGFSHVWPGTDIGLTASDIAEVRFYCHTSSHNRVINFSMNNDWVKTAILTEASRVTLYRTGPRAPRSSRGTRRTSRIPRMKSSQMCGFRLTSYHLTLPSSIIRSSKATETRNNVGL